MHLADALQSNKTIRTVGFDDAPFERRGSRPVGVAGVVCKGTRFDGMVWGEVAPDGDDATERVIALIEGGKFHAQLHAVLLDGIAFAGFNVVDLPQLAEQLDRPCIAVIRKRPDFEAIDTALENVEGAEAKRRRIRRAGDVHEAASALFQVHGCEPETAAELVDRLTVDGHIPEPVRLAHLVASAVATGESGRRA